MDRGCFAKLIVVYGVFMTHFGISPFVQYVHESVIGAQTVYTATL